MKVPGRVVACAATLLVLAACTSEGGDPLFGSQPGGATTTGVTAGSSTTGTIPGGETVPEDTTTSTTSTTAATVSVWRPLPLYEGLGTFDSYEWRMEMRTVGPTEDETTEVVTKWEFNRDPEQRRSIVTTTQTGPDFDGTETSTTEIRQVGGETCQREDGGDWSYTSATDQQQEILRVVQRMFDLTIVPESPVEVGKEAVAGIPATHWRYTVSGFGSESGAVPSANQVDYWLADDTGVLLRYEMELESRSGPSTDPTAEIFRVEASAQLVTANEPVEVRLPRACLALADDA